MYDSYDERESRLDRLEDCIYNTVALSRSWEDATGVWAGLDWGLNRACAGRIRALGGDPDEARYEIEDLYTTDIGIEYALDMKVYQTCEPLEESDPSNLDAGDEAVNAIGEEIYDIIGHCWDCEDVMGLWGGIDWAVSRACAGRIRSLGGDPDEARAILDDYFLTNDYAINANLDFSDFAA